MAKQDFLRNLRVARNLFAHPRVFVDSRQLDPSSLAKTIAGAAIWLTPKSVSGFQAGDFPELGTARQQELSEAVSDFEKVAAGLPPTSPASDEELSNGADALTRIITILEPYLPSAQETSLIRQALKDLKLVEGVVNWDYELGSDDDGLPSIWITVFVDDNKIPRNQFGRFASELAVRARQLLTSQGIHRWPYLRIRTPQEYRSQ